MNFNFFKKKQAVAQASLEIDKNQEAVQLFAKLEKLSSEQPDVFAFFLNKYGSEMLSYYNWGDALWRTDEPQAGMFDKFIPYIQVILSVVLLFMIGKLK